MNIQDVHHSRNWYEVWKRSHMTNCITHRLYEFCYVTHVLSDIDGICKLHWNAQLISFIKQVSQANH